MLKNLGYQFAVGCGFLLALAVVIVVVAVASSACGGGDGDAWFNPETSEIQCQELHEALDWPDEMEILSIRVDKEVDRAVMGGNVCPATWELESGLYSAWCRVVGWSDDSLEMECELEPF